MDARSRVKMLRLHLDSATILLENEKQEVREARLRCKWLEQVNQNRKKIPDTSNWKKDLKQKNDKLNRVLEMLDVARVEYMAGLKFIIPINSCTIGAFTIPCDKMCEPWMLCSSMVYAAQILYVVGTCWDIHAPAPIEYDVLATESRDESWVRNVHNLECNINNLCRELKVPVASSKELFVNLAKCVAVQTRKFRTISDLQNTLSIQSEPEWKNCDYDEQHF